MFPFQHEKLPPEIQKLGRGLPHKGCVVLESCSLLSQRGVRHTLPSTFTHDRDSFHHLVPLDPRAFLLRRGRRAHGYGSSHACCGYPGVNLSSTTYREMQETVVPAKRFFHKRPLSSGQIARRTSVKYNSLVTGAVYPPASASWLSSGGNLTRAVGQRTVEL